MSNYQDLPTFKAWIDETIKKSGDQELIKEALLKSGEVVLDKAKEIMAEPFHPGGGDSSTGQLSRTAIQQWTEDGVVLGWTADGFYGKFWEFGHYNIFLDKQLKYPIYRKAMEETTEDTTEEFAAKLREEFFE